MIFVLAYLEFFNFIGLSDTVDVAGYNYKEHLYAAALVEWSTDYPLTRRAPAAPADTAEARLRTRCHRR